MMRSPLDKVLRDVGASAYIDAAADASLARTIGTLFSPGTEQLKPERLPRLAFVYETQGLRAYERWVTQRDQADEDVARQAYDKAFVCWQALLTLPAFGPDGSISAAGLDVIRHELLEEPLDPELTLAFRIAVAGLVAQRTAETRLELNRFNLTSSIDESDWRDRVIRRVFSAFALLCRKSGGWEDIDAALSGINDLRRLQAAYEDKYVESQGDEQEQIMAAAELVGVYHLAQMVSSTGEYLHDGEPGASQVLQRLDRHRERGRAAFVAVDSPLLAHLADTLWVGCRELVGNAIWTHAAPLGERAQQFARVLASKGRVRPVIELWPSQQEAFRQNLMDIYRRAFIVEMPTSAGKTLLAKFWAIQAKVLNPAATVAYIVPTRALVNQVTLDLRSDFRGFDPPIRVEQAVPAFELDPTEEQLLNDPPDVLVTTPEKLDLLVRRNHRATQNIALVIVDEAHNLADRGRGARLELLLGMLKRDRARAKFLLLSPFLPNDRDLVTWLGEDAALAPIKVDWKPSRRMVGVVATRGRGRNRRVIFETVPAADNSNIRAGLEIDIGPATDVPSPPTIKGLTRATVSALGHRGATLVLCEGPGTATSRAVQLAADVPELGSDPLRDAAIHYIEAEVGRRDALSYCLRRGIAYHHSGLSHETRWLVEGLVRRELISTVCGTTTLAQGVNFPISTVIVESLDKGDDKLTYQDFWNIAGRAGRTMMDTTGIVAFPAHTQAKREEFEGFLRGEAEKIASQLTALITRAEEIGERFDLQTMYRWPEMSTFLQFLAHAVRVSGQTNLGDDIEDILRASLVYHQIQKREDGATLVHRLLRLCTAYLEHLNELNGREGVLRLADHTGFATPSVLRLLTERRYNPELASVTSWEPQYLFGENLEPLTDRIEAIAHLPEMRLGSGTGQPFNARRVASILRDWVSGETLDTLAERYPVSNDADPDKRLGRFSKYLFSDLLGRASWGLGALEGICLAGAEDDDWRRVGYVPSMVFFGVKRRQGVWLRMAGVPRLVADSLGALWEESRTSDPRSYDDIRDWVGNLSEVEWQTSLPPSSRLTPDDMRRVWQEFVG